MKLYQVLVLTAMLQTFSLASSQTPMPNLEDERTTNLVIINDVTETLEADLYPETVEQAMKKQSVAMALDITYALMNNQLVLCTTSLLASYQKLNEIWQFFATASDETIINKYISHDPHAQPTIEQQKAAEEDITALDITKTSTLIKKMNTAYQQLNTADQPATLLSQINADFIKDRLDPNTYPEFFAFYQCSQIIKALGYIFKQITPEFVLCIPQQLQHPDKNLANTFIGLNWSNLPDFPFMQLSSEMMTKIFENAHIINEQEALGQKLLLALKKIQIPFSDTTKYRLPYFNIFIDGHGTPNSMTAEISIQLQKDPKAKTATSDFLNILHFFNDAFRMKSLTISSCYPAGQKFISTFDISNQFNNTYLQSIYYPLIINGTTFASNSALVEVKAPFEKNNVQFYTQQHLYGPSTASNPYLTMFSRYFELLNQTPANFERAAMVIAPLYRESAQLDFLENYVSIKFPNTSWFTPVEYKKFVKNLSQIAVSTKPTTSTIKIPEKIKIVLLGANYIPLSVEIKLGSYIETYILPVNYHNQNYFFNKITLSGSSIYSLKNIAPIFFPVKGIEEPMYIAIKELTTNNHDSLETYSNVCFFTYHQLEGIEEPQSGYCYTDEQGKTWINHWPSDSEEDVKDMLIFKQAKSFDATQALTLIAQVEAKAKKSFMSYEPIEQNLIAQKQAKETKNLPSKVRESIALQESRSLEEQYKELYGKDWKEQFEKVLGGNWEKHPLTEKQKEALETQIYQQQITTPQPNTGNQEQTYVKKQIKGKTVWELVPQS